jgi:hypothetical protein
MSLKKRLGEVAFWSNWAFSSLLAAFFIVAIFALIGIMVIGGS